MKAFNPGPLIPNKMFPNTARIAPILHVIRGPNVSKHTFFFFNTTERAEEDFDEMQFIITKGIAKRKEKLGLKKE